MSIDVLESCWSSPSIFPAPKDNEVHVWCTGLDLSAKQIQRLEQTLAPDEQEHARQFRFVKDRTHFIAARGLLRLLLGRYLNQDPQILRFCYNAYGKPALSREASNEVVSFNVTHSHGMALYAITHKREIGIDVEYIHELEYAEIAKQFFSPDEMKMLNAVPLELRLTAFFRCWTRKEACLKAHGTGLSLDLQQIDVSTTGGTVIINSRAKNQFSTCWWLHDLTPDTNYIAALAVDGQPCSVTCWQLSGAAFQKNSIVL